MNEIKRRVKNDAGNSFTLMVNCDMSGLTTEQIKEYAFDAIWIKEQSNLRALSNKAFEDMNGKYAFKATPKGVRAARKPMTKEEVLAYIAGLPKDERKAMLDLIPE